MKKLSLIFLLLNISSWLYGQQKLPNACDLLNSTYYEESINFIREQEGSSENLEGVFFWCTEIFTKGSIQIFAFSLKSSHPTHYLVILEDESAKYLSDYSSQAIVETALSLTKKEHLSPKEQEKLLIALVDFLIIKTYEHDFVLVEEE